MSATTTERFTHLGHIRLDHSTGKMSFILSALPSELPDGVADIRDEAGMKCALLTTVISDIISESDDAEDAYDLLGAVLEGTKEITRSKIQLHKTLGKKKIKDDKEPIHKEHIYTKEEPKDFDEGFDPCDECDGCDKATVISIDKDDVYDIVKAAVRALADTVKEVLNND